MKMTASGDTDSLRNASEREQLFHEAWTAIVDEVDSYTTNDQKRIHKNLSFLVDHGKPTLHEIMDLSKPDSLEKYLWSERLRTENFAPDPNDKVDQRTSRVYFTTRYRIALISDAFVRKISALEGWDQNATHAAMLTYESMIENVLSKRSKLNARRVGVPDRTIEAVALIAYIQGWFKVPGYSFDKNRETATAQEVDYVASRVEDVWGILPELVARKDHSREMIEMLSDSDTPALAVGVL